MKTDPTLPDPVEAAVKAIDSLLTAIEGKPGTGAEAAYRAAIVRHGRELIASGGTKAMRNVLDQVAGQGEDRMWRRTIIHDAWARVPGWYLGAGAAA